MPYSPTWGDKHFQKGFRDALQNLNKAKREEVTRKRQQELRNLFEALRTASDLILRSGDGDLRPSRAWSHSGEVGSSSTAARASSG